MISVKYKCWCIVIHRPTLKMLKKEYLEANAFSAHLERVLFYCFQSGKDLTIHVQRDVIWLNRIKLSYDRNLEGQYSKIGAQSKKLILLLLLGKIETKCIAEELFLKVIDLNSW